MLRICFFLIICLHAWAVTAFLIAPAEDENATASKPDQPDTEAAQESLTGDEDCEQLYPRLFYTAKPDKMLIKFNTKSPCSRSYVLVEQNYSVIKFFCSNDILSIQQSTNYVRYIQNCPVDINTKLQEFKYTVYGRGLAGEQTENLRYKGQFRVNIPRSSKTMNIIVTADWGPIQVKKYYTPIYPSLVKEIQTNQNQIHALMIMGDIAYDLNSNQCAQYDLFMSELEAVSPYWPIIPIYGNHESAYPLSYEIFTKTFQTYGLDSKQRVQTYRFWNFKIVTFNPFLEIYERSTEEDYAILRNALLESLAADASKPAQFVLLTSHYPVICSQLVFHCQQTLKILAPLYSQLSRLKQVDLYLGGHMHIYERVVPFNAGNFMNSSLGPYGKGEMPSIVEGVAGNDIGVNEQDWAVAGYTVAHTHNRTGYGMLNVYNLEGYPYAKYTHYVTDGDKGATIFDQVSFNTARTRPILNIDN